MKSLKYIWLTAIVLLSVGFASCDKDDEYFDDKYQGRKIVIEKVFLEDVESSVPDREVTFARLGQMIRLEGHGFMGMKKVYINGYETYFNRAYVSDNSMLVTLNTKTPITNADENVRNTIRLVKDRTETIYEFEIRAAFPSITSVSNTLPGAGQKVTIYGSSLHETYLITLPGGIEVTDNIENDPDGEWYSFVMPSGVSQAGCITSDGANGKTQSPDFFNNRNCMILDFDGNGVHGFWGSSNKDENDNIKPGVSMIYDTDLVDDPLGTGYGKVCQLIPQRLLNEGGISSAKPRATEVWTTGNKHETEDWTRMTPFIPATTPLTEVALQFEVYIPNPWSLTGQIVITLVNNISFSGYNGDERNSNTFFYIPWLVTDNEGNPASIPFFTEGWTTVTVPLSEFNNYKAILEDKEAVAPTFQDVITLRNDASNQQFGMGFVNSDIEVTYTNDKGKEAVAKFPSALSTQEIYIDNWRIVPYKFVTISDYPEDEETEE